MMRTIAAIALFFLATSALPVPAAAATPGTWMGQVVYVNSRHIGVKSNAQTRDFVIDSGTTFSVNGKASSAAHVATGATVTVHFSQSSFFGSTKATSVHVMTFTLPAPAPASTPQPLQARTKKALRYSVSGIAG